MKTQDEIYRIFYLIDHLKKEYLESDLKPPRRKLEELAEAITKSEHTRDPEDKKDKGIGDKTLERLLNYENEPWDISYRSLNAITRFIKGSLWAEFSNTVFIKEIEEDLNNFKQENKDELNAIFEKFEKFKEPNSKGNQVLYNFKGGTKKPAIKTFEKIPYLEQLAQNLEQRINLLESGGIRQALTEEEISRLKNYFNIWSDKKISNIYSDFLENELQKTYKKLNRAIWLNRYFGFIGLFFVAIPKDNIPKKLQLWLEKEFHIEFEDEINDLDSNSEIEEEGNAEENNPDIQ